MDYNRNIIARAKVITASGIVRKICYIIIRIIVMWRKILDENSIVFLSKWFPYTFLHLVPNMVAVTEINIPVVGQK